MKTLVPVSLFSEAEACNFIKKENLAQVFSSDFCEIAKNGFSFRTPPVAASVILKPFNQNENGLIFNKSIFNY